MQASNSYDESDASHPLYYLQDMGSPYSDPRSGLNDYSLSSCSATALYPDSFSDHMYGSPIASSSPAEDPNHHHHHHRHHHHPHHHLQHKMNELEQVVKGPGQAQVVPIPVADLKHMLMACAGAIDDNNMPLVELLISELRLMVSVSGDPIQRLGAYLLEGLVARLASSGSLIYKALRCREPTSSELLSYMHVLYEVCPYFKFGYMSANGAIAEAVKGEIRVHVIDFQIAMGTQWVTLIQALAARPGGPPHVRITGIDDPISVHARGGGMELVGQQLAQLAESCGVPFEFHGVPVAPEEVEVAHLGVRPGEALAVNFAYQLHHIPDESVSTWNHRDRVLRMIKGLSPKVVTLVEQESNTNTSPFLPRFAETLSYYTAIFESIDVRLPRESKERINVEQHCLAKDIVNIVACEGAERMERHELMGKWKLRFSMAGFSPCQLSPLVNATIKSLLENYCEHYRLEERDDVLYLGWKDRALVVSSAWR